MSEKCCNSNQFQFSRYLHVVKIQHNCANMPTQRISRISLICIIKKHWKFHSPFLSLLSCKCEIMFALTGHYEHNYSKQVALSLSRIYTTLRIGDTLYYLVQLQCPQSALANHTSPSSTGLHFPIFLCLSAYHI